MCVGVVAGIFHPHQLGVNGGADLVAGFSPGQVLLTRTRYSEEFQCGSFPCWGGSGQLWQGKLTNCGAHGVCLSQTCAHGAHSTSSGAAQGLCDPVRPSVSLQALQLVALWPQPRISTGQGLSSVFSGLPC
jgi:hypothetical protein